MCAPLTARAARTPRTLRVCPLLTCDAHYNERRGSQNTNARYRPPDLQPAVGPHVHVRSAPCVSALCCCRARGRCRGMSMCAPATVQSRPFDGPCRAHAPRLAWLPSVACDAHDNEKIGSQNTNARHPPPDAEQALAPHVHVRPCHGPEPRRAARVIRSAPHLAWLPSVACDAHYNERMGSQNANARHRPPDPQPAVGPHVHVRPCDSAEPRRAARVIPCRQQRCREESQFQNEDHTCLFRDERQHL